VKKAQRETLRTVVRERYAGIARGGSEGCGCAPSSCCGEGTAGAEASAPVSVRMGYSAEEMAAVPAGADLGLGCGNPQAIAELKPGEVVLDLGSGGGFDCFLAARQVGPVGKVIGIDMTPEMMERARRNAEAGGYGNVDFRLGEIEHLPLADASVDVVIYNCVINLSTDKPAVFREAHRVLRPGGRLAVSDVVATAELPQELLQDPQLYAACAAGAVTVPELERMMAEAGFTDIEVAPKDESREFIREWIPGRNLDDYILSAYIRARKGSD